MLKTNKFKVSLAVLLLGLSLSPFQNFSSVQAPVHPGLLHTQQQLDLYKKQVNGAAASSQLGLAYARIADDPRSSSSYVAYPYKTPDQLAAEASAAEPGDAAAKAAAGAAAKAAAKKFAQDQTIWVQGNVKGPKIHTQAAFKNDAIAAYLNALKWVKTGQKENAENAIRILNAWPSKVRDMRAIQTACSDAEVRAKTNPNCTGSRLQDRLVAAWTMPMWLNAAEIIRHYKSTSGGKAGWADKDINLFTAMMGRLNDHARLAIDRGSNWGTSAAMAAMAYGVFMGGSSGWSIYNESLSKLKEHLGEVIIGQDQTLSYKHEFDLDGVHVNTTTKTLQKKGELLELSTRGDCGHPQYSLTGLVQGAMIASNQGDNSVWLHQDKRLKRGIEFLAKAANNRTAGHVRSSGALYNPPNLVPVHKADLGQEVKCGPFEGYSLQPGYGFYAYAFYRNLGVAVPELEQVLMNDRGSEGSNTNFLGWSTVMVSGIP